MKLYIKRVFIILLSEVMLLTSLSVGVSADEVVSAPKYIFMFIGDGMGITQTQLTAYYNSYFADTNDNAILEADSTLNFMDFPSVGLSRTYDSSSFIPMSSSAGTALATGRKTYSPRIGINENGTLDFMSIAERLKLQRGYKIGIITTCPLDDATPAAFYASVESRNDYNTIANQLAVSDFDYFAGAPFRDPIKDGRDVYDAVRKNGYTIADTPALFNALDSDSGKALALLKTNGFDEYSSYAIDNHGLRLADYVDKGIELLYGDQGFFIMAEGGIIDIACHDNDAATVVAETLDFSDAISSALDFYNQHPDDTLIIVTADHETGGMTLGVSQNGYDGCYYLLKNQKTSALKFSFTKVQAYIDNKTDFETAMSGVTKAFGLRLPNSSNADNPLTLTQGEIDRLRDAYEYTLQYGIVERGSEYAYIYGDYLYPFAFVAAKILCEKSSVGFTTIKHTGAPVGVYAIGVGAEHFVGYYDNTNIYKQLCLITGVTDQTIQIFADNVRVSVTADNLTDKLFTGTINYSNGNSIQINGQSLIRLSALLVKNGVKLYGSRKIKSVTVIGSDGYSAEISAEELYLPDTVFVMTEAIDERGTVSPRLVVLIDEDDSRSVKNIEQINVNY